MLNRILNSKLLFIFMVCLIMFSCFKKSDRYFGLVQYHNHESYPVISDGSGYYAFLPQWFIYKTDNFEFMDSIQEKYPDARFSDGFSYDFESEKRFNKYFIGTAVLQAPGFLITHYIATVFHLDNDGYSNAYQLYTVLLAFIFAFIGFWCISKILSYYNVSRFTKLVTILAIALGTNIGSFVIYNSSFSHVYSFALISLFTLTLYRWRAAANPLKSLPLIGILLGFIFILRPTDAIIALLIPFFFKSKENIPLFFRTIFTTKAFIYFLIAILLFIFPIFLQVLSTYQQLGKWALNSYVGEGFDYLLNPHIIDVLFSFRKGLFIYSPILIISIIGFYVFWKKDRAIAIGSISLLIIFTYITASWWCWWYGGGLGMRPYINIFVLFAIPFGILIDVTRSYWKTILLLLSMGCIFLYQIFQIQMVQNILHYEDMNVAQFKKIFLQTGHRFDWSLHREFDTLPTQKADFVKTEFIENKNLKIYHDYEPSKLIKITVAVDTSYKQWAGSIKGYVKITEEDQNPNFDVQYFKGSQLVKQEGFFFGGEIPKINKYYPLQINFNPKDIETLLYDKVEIVLYPGAENLYFNRSEFQSFYYE